MSLCISSLGYTAAENIRAGGVALASVPKQLLSAVAFTAHAKETVENFKKLSNVASRGMDVEEAQHGHLRDTYWPAEDKFLAEFVQPTAWDSQAVLTDRYAGRMWPTIAASFARKIHELECNKPRYCATAFRRAVQELLVARAAAKANVLTLANAIAFAEVESVSDTDFKRRQQAIALRKGLVAEAATLMSSAANGLASAGADSLRAATNAAGAFGEARGAAASDPGFFNTTGRGLRARPAQGSVGDASRIGGMGLDDDDFSSTNGDWAHDANNGLLGMTQTPGAFSANTANMTTGALHGGQQQNLVPEGSFTFITQKRGVPVTIRVGNLPLASAADYQSNQLKTSPATLPGPSHSPGVSYSEGTGLAGGGGLGGLLGGLFGGIF